MVCDYRSGATQVMSYLAQLGHKKIGLINGAPEAQTQRGPAERLSGSHAEQRNRSGRRVGQRWAIYRGGRGHVLAAAADCSEEHPDVTALFAGNDKMALGLPCTI